MRRDGVQIEMEIVVSRPARKRRGQISIRAARHELLALPSKMVESAQDAPFLIVGDKPQCLLDL
jgi:hypothetical protein